MTTPRKLPTGIRKLPNGRYQARYPVTTGGVTRQMSAGTFASLAEAKDARAVQLAKRKTGGWVNPLGPRTTVATWADQWQELRHGRHSKEASFLRARIKPYWGEHRLGDITPLDVQRWVTSLSVDGLKPATVHQVYATFKRMLQEAVDNDLLVKTPCRKIDLPRDERHQPVQLSVEDLLLLERNAPPRYAAMIHLGAWAGLRWQECAALRWEDVDLELGVLRIRQAVKVDGTIGTTKNRKERIVPIPASTVEVLRRHRRDFGTADLLFVGERSGRTMNYNSFRQNIWSKIVIACELDPAPSFHDLRHAHAAHMTRIGMDIAVLSERLGHHKQSFTADRYGWRRADFHTVSVSMIEAAMRGD